MRVLVINGPNLNLLGEREPEIYGTQTLVDVNEVVAAAASDLRVGADFLQFNGEGQIIDALHAARGEYDAIIINPGAFAHYSYAIADAIAAIPIPVIEVHLSNIAAREAHRRTSVTASACIGSITGFGPRGYVLAVNVLAQMLGK